MDINSSLQQSLQSSKLLKRFHTTIQSKVDIPICSIHPIVKSSSLKFTNKIKVPLYRQNYLLSRINNSIYIQPQHTTIRVHSAEDSSNLASVLLGETTKSICPLNDTDNVIVSKYSQDKTNDIFSLVNLKQARARKIKADQSLADKVFSYATPLSQNTFVFNYQRQQPMIAKITNPDSFEDFSYEIIHQTPFPFSTRSKLLNTSCLVGNMSIEQNTNNLCFMDIPSVKNKRQHKINGVIYCMSRLDDNTIIIGGDQENIYAFDQRVYKKIWNIPVKERWIGDICMLDETRILYSDWNKLVDYDVRMGTTQVHQNNTSGIWGIHVLNQNRIVTVGSDPGTHFYTTE